MTRVAGSDPPTAVVTACEGAVKLADQTNRHLCVLSIMTALFLPPALIVGALGMNTGGLPLTQASEKHDCARQAITLRRSGTGAWMSAMLSHTATLKYSDIQATSLLQSSQRWETTQRWETSMRPWAMLM